jgi:hypothetical protein
MEPTHVSAQTGRESAAERPQLWIEFWIIELHITVVVKRAYKALVFVRSTFPQPSRTVYLAECQIVKLIKSFKRAL